MKMSQEAKKTKLYSSRVVYVCDLLLFKECDKIPNICGRAILVHNLIRAYDLLSHMHLIPSEPASEDILLSFHSRNYIEFLQKVEESSDLENHEEDLLEFGLAYDCPLVEGIYKFVQSIAGASITCAQVLVDGLARIAINWCGGWHHAQRDEAEGFCYVNDIVLAIHKLREKFSRILYIDFDLHHGNGVENAFSFSPHVMTLSLHKYEPGFYPGSGGLSDVGLGQGRYYTVNVPLKEGVRDDNYFTIFQSIANKVWSTFCPNAVVVQCGADCINGDPACGFNLTPRGIGRCIENVLAWNVPTLFLGGGGYNLPNTARCWTYLTSIILGLQITSSIPDSNLDFMCYSPDFELDIVRGNRSDLNTAEDMKHLTETICKNLDNIAEGHK
ncbi:histone deacetylase 8-like isoform X2 [Zootermopsis nevadensis]|uniref:histone deacetylase 8-like isoform X2 n=1 Tax=Zootermopsis nevadensis TaxID=136037 RepID=UPI000B8E4996|nr:histone deacetylase 8-like isoform X2 [Zootermopsis nevadensis]